MAAPKGNKNAEKWTQETVLSILDAIEIMAKEAKAIYLTEALLYFELYPQIWSDWKKKFVEDEIVSESIKRIEKHFEVILYTGALKGDFVPSVAIFGLKNNHGWKDKTEVENTHSFSGKNLNIKINPEGELPSVK